jgi:hypothetical protein
MSKSKEIVKNTQRRGRKLCQQIARNVNTTVCQTVRTMNYENYTPSSIKKATRTQAMNPDLIAPRNNELVQPLR